MSYFVIENFNRGLDARKHTMNLLPGCLSRGKNININRGGEPESAKAFVPKGVIPSGPTGTDPTFGLLACGGKLYVFGSYDYAPSDMPNGITYQRLQHPGGGWMTGVVVQTAVKGKPFVVATFTTGHGVYFNGNFIEDWGSVSGMTANLKETSLLPLGDWKRHGATPFVVASIAEVAANFALQINGVPGYTASAAGAVVTVTGPPNAPFGIAASASNGGSVNDQTATVATPQNATSPTTGNKATNIFVIEATFIGGPAPGGYMAIQYITVGGSMICGAVFANSREGAAQACASAINAFDSFPKYTATASGSAVTIIAADAGASPNGQSVNVISSHVTGGGTMGGGVDPVPGVPQISTVTFGGTFENGDLYSISIGGASFTVAAVLPSDSSGAGGGVTAANGIMPVAVLPKNSKTYAIAGPNMFGSAIGDCTQWNSGTGSFITDMSSELAGAQTLTAMALFQGNLAVFSRSTVQIRFVDPDPALNEQLQAMQNIGTMAPKSVTAFGDADVFFLSDTGVRSLKVRAATDSATVADIGSPIDPLIIAAIKANSASTLTRAVGAIEPVDGRFFLQIGTTTYVFNFFPDAKVAAWTIYETGLAITDFATIDTKFFARAGNTVYLLGGDNNDQYTASPPDIKIPFISAKQIATLKHFKALDVICDGVFDVTISTDPIHPDEEETICTVNGTTLGLGINAFAGEDVTAIALRFTGRPSKYARLSALAVHHEVLGENAL